MLTSTPPIGFNATMLRNYVSSVDGTILPCSMFVPTSWGNKMPVWVDLHAFGGPGGISENMALNARAYGCVIIAPWGRNYHSFFVDGKDRPGAPEPCMMDEFTGGGADDWDPIKGDRWQALSDSYQQLDPTDTWKVAGRDGSSGRWYSASVDMRAFDNSGTDGIGEFAGGLMVRMQDNGDGYMVNLDSGAWGAKYLQVFKRVDSKLTKLAETGLPFTTNLGVVHNLKVVMWDDILEVHLDRTPVAGVQDGTFDSGGVGLVSYGAKHQYDNFRLQNESLYGEQDVFDTVCQALEDLRSSGADVADSSRVFIAGQSMGGMGALNLGLHYPDLFSYVHPSYACTDVAEGYEWVNSQYPDQDPSVPVGGRYFDREQDRGIIEAMKAMSGGLDPGSGDPALMSGMHQNSARYILENALNTPVRLEHPEYDCLVPNTTAPMTIKWVDTAGGLVEVKKGDERPSADCANGKNLWQTWSEAPGLTNCTPETSLYDPASGSPGSAVPTLGIWDNRDYSAMADHAYGAHCAVIGDAVLAGPVIQSFNRLNARYGSLHVDPEEVAYRTYDGAHRGAWWVTFKAAYPDQDKPALARVRRDIPGNAVNMHVKNVEKTALDLLRMKLNVLSGPLTVKVDADTAPESEFKVTDECRRTDLILVGRWFPEKEAGYQVTLDGNPVAFDMSCTALTLSGIETSSDTKTVVVEPPAGLEELSARSVANPGFESGTAGWSENMDGGVNGIFELNQQQVLSHTGGNSIRIKDPKATAAPYMSSWQSNAVPVQAGKSYSLSAFAKTRAFNSVSRSYQDGKYAPGTESGAGVGIIWLKADGTAAGTEMSAGIRDTTDWTPLEITKTAPAGATRARAMLYTSCPNGQGISGSVWFDDITFITETPAGGLSISPASGVNTGVLSATIGGAGFKQGAAVRLEQGTAVVNAGNVVVAPSGASITCDFNLSGLAAGKYDVVVKNPDGQEMRLEAGFSVTSGCGNGAGALVTVFAAALGLVSLARHRFDRLSRN